MPGTLQVIAAEKEWASHEKDYKIAAENLRYDFNRSRSSLHTRYERDRIAIRSAELPHTTRLEELRKQEKAAWAEFRDFRRRVIVPIETEIKKVLVAREQHERELAKKTQALTQEYEDKKRALQVKWARDLRKARIEIFGYDIHRDRTGAKRVKKRVFTTPCPRDECRGFLSQEGICGLCSYTACVKCHADLNSCLL